MCDGLSSCADVFMMFVCNSFPAPAVQDIKEGENSCRYILPFFLKLWQIHEWVLLGGWNMGIEVFSFVGSRSELWQIVPARW